LLPNEQNFLTAALARQRILGFSAQPQPLEQAGGKN
jgi:hypothetical protein